MSMRFLKYSGIAVLVVITALAGYAYLKAGDYILEYLTSSMGLKISYKNSCDFTGGCIFRSTVLYDVKVSMPGQGVWLSCPKVIVGFDYSALRSKKSVGLNFLFDRPVIHISETGPSSKILDGLVPDTLANLSGALANGDLKDIFCDISLREDEVDIRQLGIFSKNVFVTGRGRINKRGDVKAGIKAFFSGDLLSGLPPRVLDILDDTTGGWKKLDLTVTNRVKPRLFKLESPRLRLVIGDETGL